MTKILGVDHICTSCNNISLAAKRFHNLQYNIMFREHGLHIPKEKKPFLKEFTKSHDAVFLKSDKGLAIEVIDHNSGLSEIGPYKVLFKKRNESFSNKKNIKNDPIKQVIEKAFGFPVSLKKVSDLNILYYNHEGNSYNGLSAVILECESLSVSSKFWKKGIGFQTIKEVVNEKLPWCLVEFPGLVSSMKAKLLLIETKKIKTKSYLDYSGWTCLSFIVKGINSALKQVKDFGAIDIGQPYKIAIGGNNLLLSFFRGPEGELIEFIELANN